jgi:hypothetical protein
MRFVTKLGWITLDVDSSLLTASYADLVDADKETPKQEKLLRIRSGLLATVYMHSHSDLTESMSDTSKFASHCFCLVEQWRLVNSIDKIILF